MMESTYSCSSFSGLVSSKRRLVLPPTSAARPKLRQMDFAWPMCRYPLGSGGKRVCTLPPYLLVLRSSRMMSRIKFDGRSEDSAGVAVAASSLWVDEDMIAVPQFKTTKNAEKASFACLLYTSDAADEEDSVDLGGRRII